MTRLLRIKMAVAGVLGDECRVCGRGGFWAHAATALPLAMPPKLYQEWKDAHLQVGHPNGRRWSIRRVNTLQRRSRYLKEALRGAVQAECGPCNRKHGGSLRYEKREKSPRGGRS